MNYCAFAPRSFALEPDYKLLFPNSDSRIQQALPLPPDYS